jgi:heat-inducible transcriptional repressor
VEQLAGAARAMNLTLERREQIDDSFAGVGSSQQFLERTSHVLALVSSGVGVALAPMSEAQMLEHIHFSRLSAGRVLAVVVTTAGAVQDRVLLLDRDMPLGELEASARFLNENFHGWSIERIRLELDRRIDEERTEYDRLMRAVNELYRKGALESEAGSGPVIFVEGVANLLAGEVDRERLRMMLTALEAKQRLIELLNAYVDARQRTVRVVVGLEKTVPGMENLVLIGSPARMGAENVGTVAVIGSTRIQYEETMNAVAYIAQLSDKIFQED